jgi:hypothetical protein
MADTVGGAAPDISIDYEAIKTVATKLQAAHDDIAPRIAILAATVSGLLTQDGGLWMDQTSPTIQTAYTTFNTSAVNVVDAINGFYKMFTQFVIDIQGMDQQYSDGIKKGG